MSAVVVTFALLATFALWVTVHCALVFGLFRSADRGWWLVLLLLPPTLVLAPYWGLRAGLKGRAVTWLALFALYAVLLLVGSLWRSPG